MAQATQYSATSASPPAKKAAKISSVHPEGASNGDTSISVMQTRPADGSQRPRARSLIRQATTSLVEVDRVYDPDWAGLKPPESENSCCVLPTLAKSLKNMSPQERFFMILKGYPTHFYLELSNTIPVIIVAMIPILVGAMDANVISSELPYGNYNYTREESLEELSTRADELSFGANVLHLVMRHSMIGVYLMGYTVLRSLWSFERVVYPAAKKTVVPFLIIHSIYLIAWRVAMAYGLEIPYHQAGWFVLVTLIQLALEMICFLFFCNVAGKLAEQKHFMLTCGGLFLSVGGLGAINTFLILPSVMEASDLIKMFFVGLINPIMWETTLLYARIFARSIDKSHPSTCCMFVVPVQATKKALARFVCATVTDNTILNLTMIMVSVAEVSATATIVKRDKRMYRLLWGEQNTNANAIMGLARNKQLRVSSAAAESCLEYTMIVAGVVIVLLYGVSTESDRSKPQPLPDVGGVLLNGLVQIFYEVLVDIANVIILTVFQGHDYMETAAKTKFKWWWLSIGGVAFFANSLMVVLCIPRVLMRTGTHEANWVFGSLPLFSKS